jgi:hypothetical protein
LEADRFIVYVDPKGDVLWETTPEHDAEGPSDAARHNEILSEEALIESTPCSALDPAALTNFKRLLGEAIARSLENDYDMWNDELEEIISPLIGRSMQELRNVAAPLLATTPPDGTGDRFRSLLNSCRALIQSVVFYELARDVQPVGLGLFSEMAQQVDQLDIFTLNHDSLLDAQLEAAAVDFTDGFENQQNGYCIFSPNWKSASVRLLKLHGALNWRYCRFTNADGSKWDQTAIFARQVADCRYNKNPIEVREEFNFLTGTTVKENSYGHDIIGDLFIEFRHLSSQSRTMVFAGYGWGDKGINIRIDQWLRDQRQNKLIILHQGDERLVSEKRFWLTRWQKYRNAGKLRLLPHWPANCPPDELARELVFD